VLARLGAIREAAFALRDTGVRDRWTLRGFASCACRRATHGADIRA
jgi:hypothetical protein